MKKISILSAVIVAFILCILYVINDNSSSIARHSNDQLYVQYYDGKDTLHMHADKLTLNTFPEKAILKLGEDTIYKVDKADYYKNDLKKAKEGDIIILSRDPDTTKLTIEIKRKEQEYSKVPL